MALIPAIARPSKDPKKKTTKSTKKRSWSTDAPIFLRVSHSQRLARLRISLDLTVLGLTFVLLLFIRKRTP